MGKGRGPLYCIDASALIGLKRTYPEDVFRSLWRELAALAEQGRLIAPREVLNEIERWEDDLSEWVKRHKKMFKPLDHEQLRHVQDVLAKFSGLIDKNKQTPDADPFLIALAMVRKRPRNALLYPVDCIVVTQEKPSRGGRPKIPDVCAHYGVECIDILTLFRRENWQL